MNQEELLCMGQALTEILDNNNHVRKSGEEKLNQMKSFDIDKYAGYLTAILTSGKINNISLP